VRRRSFARLLVAPFRAQGQRRSQTRFYSQFVSPGDLVFDIGANVGDRAAVFVSLGARVVAVEPSEDCASKLSRRFRDKHGVCVLPTGLAAEEGIQELYVSSLHPLSSMSPEFIEATRRSGRFALVEWPVVRSVPVTTLDRLIEQHGKPAFCKIDVEGYEAEVLRGLTTPVPLLSVEFICERLQATEEAVSHLERLGPFEFNYSLGESMELANPEWMTRAAVLGALKEVCLGAGLVWGDVYARSS
jgi:FkbM family methyltransferase